MAGKTADLLIQIQATTDQLRRELAKGETAVATSSVKMQGALDKLNAKFAAVGLAAKAGFAAVAANFTVGAIRNTLSSLDDLGDTADKLGLTAEELQKITYAVRALGGETADIDSAFSRFTKNIAEAVNGSGKFGEILNTLGVSLRNQDGSLKSTTDILKEYADKVTAATTPAEQLRLTTEAFGRGGGSFVNVLRQGGEALDQAFVNATNLGQVLDNDTVAAAGRLNEEFDKIATRLSNIYKQIVVDIAGGIDRLVNGPGLDEKILSAEKRLADLYTLLAKADEGGGSTSFGRYSVSRDELQKRFDSEVKNYDALLAKKKALEKPPAATIAPSLSPPERARTAKPSAEKRRAASNDNLGLGAESAKQAADAIRLIDERNAKIDDTLRNLEFEYQQLGLYNVQQRISNELRTAGVDAASAQGQEIAAVVEKIEAQREAMQTQQELVDKLRGAFDEFTSSVGNAFQQAIVNGEKFKNVLQSLIPILISVATRTFITDPLSKGLGDVFGSVAASFGSSAVAAGASNSNFVTGGALSFGGARAAGGPISAGRAYLVGERGPEVIVPALSGTVIPNNRLGGGGNSAPIINVINQHGGAQVQATPQGKNADGREVVDLVIREVAANIRRGGEVLQATQARLNVGTRVIR